MIGNAGEILYGDFPRTVGVSVRDHGLYQYFVHSLGELELVYDKIRADSNFYSSICRFRPDMRPVLDKVCFDFDSPMKEAAFTENISDKEKIDRMREDEELAEEVLGDVWEDAQKLVRKCQEEGIPVISVFSGLGIHCHLLFQEQVDPVEEITSTSQWLIEECDLSTFDQQIIGDTRRVLRVPNSQRIDSGGSTATWIIPMTEQEVLDNSAHDVLLRSTSPKTIPKHDRYLEDRPEMEVKEGYEDVDRESVGKVDMEERDTDSVIPYEAEWIVDNCIAMPCVSERFKQSNPKHYVRLAGVIHLYNAGFSPGEVYNVIESLGWIDFDPDITEKMLRQIYKSGYSDMSCQTMKNNGLCVYGLGMEEYGDDSKECPSFGWRGGECEWQKA